MFNRGITVSVSAVDMDNKFTIHMGDKFIQFEDVDGVRDNIIQRLKEAAKINADPRDIKITEQEKEIERLREALRKIVKESEISIDEQHAFNGLLAAEYIARSALKQKESE